MKTITESRGMATAKIMADLTSMMNAATIAPTTIKGERINSLRNILTPFWT